VSSEHGGSDSTAPQHSALSELDKKGFEAGSYVKTLLENEGLEGVLRIEAALVGEIRGLDGERKALVYDNYSKLIAATDTIKKVLGSHMPLD
jgi:vacuolar protein sorting-associated protein 51